MAPSWLLAPAALAKRLRGSPMPLLALDVSPSRVGLAICANPALGLATVPLELARSGEIGIGFTMASNSRAAAFHQASCP